MQPIRRSFSGEADLQAMAALARAFPADHLHVIDLPYRFGSWAFDDPENVGLWVDPGGQLLAWAVMQAPFWAIDYAYHPDADRDLRRRLWTWAVGRARALRDTPFGRPMWFANVFADQPERIRDLEEVGFASQVDVGEDSWSKVFMRRAAAVPVDEGALPAGFAIRPLAGEAEVDAYVALHRNVFESENMTSAWRAHTLRCPEHTPDLDLVAVAPDGRLAGFCIAWLDRSQETRGQIEPLGVRTEFRTLGLGRALLYEGVRRLIRHGASQIYVETDNYRDAALELYEGCGFRVVRDVLVYRQEYETR
jgi:mycothiol synthase